MSTRRNQSLIDASFDNNLETVLILLQSGAEVNHTNKIGDTALMVASKQGFDEIVKVLLQHGAHPSLVNHSGYSALTYALKYNHTSIVRLLLQYGAILPEDYHLLNDQTDEEEFVKKKCCGCLSFFIRST